MKYSDLDLERKRCLVEFIRTQALAIALLSQELEENCPELSFALTMQVKSAMENVTDTEVENFVSELDYLFETESVIPVPIFKEMIDNTMN